MIDVGSAVGYLMLDTSKFTSGFQSALGSLKTLQDDSVSTSDKFTAMGSALSSVGGTLTKSVTLPLVGIGTAAVKVSSDFDASMSQVAAISGATGDDLEALRNKAKEMGATTKFSASESADALTYMAMAGWKTNDMLDGLDGIMNLAAASGEDLATTSDIVTDALTGFGLTAADSSHFADVLAAASSNANTNVSLLGESFKYVAPVAGALGYSAEDTSIALGLMANSGIKGSQAGTALRASLTNLISPTDTAATAMEQYGIEMTNADGTMKSLGEVMDMLRTNLGGLDEATQASVASTLFGKEAMSGMLAIINASESDYQKLTDAIYGCDGAAAQMSATMQDNLQGDITIFKSALEGAGIAIGEVLTPMLRSLVQHITNIVSAFTAADPALQKVVVIIGMVAAAVGPLLLVLGKMSSSIGAIINLIGGAGGLSSVLSLLTGPIGIVVAAVAALAVAWITDFGGIRDKTEQVFTSIKTIINTIMTAIKKLWNSNLLGIRDIAKTVWDAIQKIFSNAFQVISNMFQIFAAIFQGDWSQVWNLVKDTASLIWDTIKTLFTAFLDIIVSILRSIGSSLLGAAREVFEMVKQGFVEKWEAIKSWFSGAKDAIPNTLKGIGTTLYSVGRNVFNRILDGFKSVWSSITSWVSEKVSWISNKVRSIISSIGSIGSSVGKVSGSHASGLDYVPRDGYIAELHRGERVLTAQENAEYTKGQIGGGDTFIFNSPEALTPVKAAREFKRVKKELALGFM